jgi:hypothetical protein
MQLLIAGRGSPTIVLEAGSGSTSRTWRTLQPELAAIARALEAMYAIKAQITDPEASSWTLRDQKTMYGGRRITTGDTIFIFASENEGGQGLLAVGRVTSATATPRKPELERQTPCVSISIQRTATAKRRLGRSELKPFSDWKDGRPETELNFKFYRQATNKIVGLSEEASAFLRTFF